MRPRSLLLLALLVAGLLAFIWFYERELPSTDERAERTDRVVALETDEVEEIVIARGGESVVLARRPPAAAEDDGEPGAEAAEGGGAERGWRLVAPLAARADGEAVERLLDSLAGLTKKRTVDEVSLETVGLAPPRGTVTVRGAGGETRLLVGAEVPASTEMVVAVDGDPRVFVVAGGLWNDLDKPPGDWRSKDVFEVEREAIARVELARRAGEESRVVLERRGQEFWLASPLVDRADRDRVSELLGDLLALRVEAFVDVPPAVPADLGLEPPQAEVLVAAGAGGEPLRLELGVETEEGGGRYARFEELVAEVGDDLDEALARSAADWQSRRWTGLEVYRIDSLRLEGEGGELRLERSGSDWLRGEERIPYAPVSDLLYAVTGVSGERVVDGDEAAALGADLAAPRLRIELVTADESESLVLYPPLASGSLAGAGERPYLLLVSEDTVGDLVAKLDRVRAAEPVPAEDSGVD